MKSSLTSGVGPRALSGHAWVRRLLVLALLLAPWLRLRGADAVVGTFNSGGGPLAAPAIVLQGGFGSPISGLSAGPQLTVVGGGSLLGLAAAAQALEKRVLVAELSAPTGLVFSGQDIPVELRLRNTGTNELKGARLEWPLPPGFELTGASTANGRVASLPTRLVVDLDPLPAGTSAILRGSLRAPPGPVAATLRLMADSESGEWTTNVSSSVVVNPPPQSPGSRWSGDDNADDAVSGHHGSFVGSPRFAPGYSGDAFLFDGTNYVAAPDALDFRPADSTFTVAAWVSFRGGPGGLQPIFAKASTLSGYDSHALVYDGSQLQFRLTSAAGYTANQGLPWTPGANVWYHLAASVDGGTVRVYINGTLVIRESLSSSFGPLAYDATAPLLLGGDGRGHAFVGLIDEAEFFPRALAEAEVKARSSFPSPRGSLEPGALVFQREDQTIWWAHADGSQPSYLTFGANPRLSLDGRYLLCYREVRQPGAQAGSLIALDLHSGAEQVALESAWFVRGFNWGPAGTNIVFAQHLRGGIVSREFPGTHEVQLADFGENPAVNPQDQRMVWNSTASAPGVGLWVADPDGSHPTPVPNTGLQDAYPAWSPDGLWIVFRDRVNWFKIHADGSDRTPLTSFSPLNPQSAPAVWTPDGLALVVTAADADGQPRPTWVPVDGVGAVAPLALVPGSPYQQVGAVSPYAAHGFADLALGVDSHTKTAVVGTAFDLRITVTNQSASAAEKAWVTCDLPTNARVEANPGEPWALDVGTRQWIARLDAVPALQAVTLGLRVTPSSSGELALSFRVQAASTDPATLDNEQRLRLLVRDALLVESPIVYQRADDSIWLLSGAGLDRFMIRGRAPSVSSDGRWLLFESVSSPPGAVSLQVLDLAVAAAGSAQPVSLGTFAAGLRHAAVWLDSGHEVLYSREDTVVSRTANRGLDLGAVQNLRLSRELPSLSDAANPEEVMIVEWFRPGAALDHVGGQVAFGDSIVRLTSASAPDFIKLERSGVPAWSADGGWLSIDTDGSDLWKARVDTGVLSALTQQPVVTVCVTPGVNGCQQYVTNLAPGAVRFEGAAVWTLDARHVVVVGREVQSVDATDAGLAEALGPRRLYAVSTDGSGRLRPLLTSPGAEPVLVGGANTVLATIDTREVLASDNRRELRLSVPADDPGLRVQSLLDLTTTGWITLPVSPLRDGHERYYELPIDLNVPSRFYRLVRE